MIRSVRVKAQGGAVVFRIWTGHGAVDFDPPLGVDEDGYITLPEWALGRVYGAIPAETTFSVDVEEF